MHSKTTSSFFRVSSVQNELSKFRGKKPGMDVQVTKPKWKDLPAVVFGEKGQAAFVEERQAFKREMAELASEAERERKWSTGRFAGRGSWRFPRWFARWSTRRFSGRFSERFFGPQKKNAGAGKRPVISAPGEAASAPSPQFFPAT